MSSAIKDILYQGFAGWLNVAVRANQIYPVKPFFLLFNRDNLNDPNDLNDLNDPNHLNHK